MSMNRNVYISLFKRPDIDLGCDSVSHTKQTVCGNGRTYDARKSKGQAAP